MRTAFALVVAVAGSVATAETVNVKYHGPVVLNALTCTDIAENSDITRVCLDAAEQYMVIRLKTTYDHYCTIDNATVQGLLRASSKRQCFDARIRGTATDGPFDCRTHPIPKKYRV